MAILHLLLFFFFKFAVLGRTKGPSCLSAYDVRQDTVHLFYFYRDYCLVYYLVLGSRFVRSIVKDASQLGRTLNYMVIGDHLFGLREGENLYGHTERIRVRERETDKQRGKILKWLLLRSGLVLLVRSVRGSSFWVISKFCREKKGHGNKPKSILYYSKENYRVTIILLSIYYYYYLFI